MFGIIEFLTFDVSGAFAPRRVATFIAAAPAAATTPTAIFEPALDFRDIFFCRTIGAFPWTFGAFPWTFGAFFWTSGALAGRTIFLTDDLRAIGFDGFFAATRFVEFEVCEAAFATVRFTDFATGRFAFTADFLAADFLTVFFGEAGFFAFAVLDELGFAAFFFSFAIDVVLLRR